MIVFTLSFNQHLLFPSQMSLENDDKRARTRSKSIRGEQLIIPLRGEVAPGLPALCLFQKGFGLSGPGFKSHTLPLLQPH